MRYLWIVVGLMCGFATNAHAGFFIFTDSVSHCMDVTVSSRPIDTDTYMWLDHFSIPLGTQLYKIGKTTISISVRNSDDDPCQGDVFNKWLKIPRNIEWVDCIRGHFIPVEGFWPVELVCDVERGLREDGIVVWREVKE